jgi:hypothetical protein
LLSVLANFHRSDAARLNPYLRKLSACDDTDFFKKVAWALNFALNTAMRSVMLTSQIKWDMASHTISRSYIKLLDDAPVEDLASGITTWLSSLRPDKAFSPIPIDPPKELFKEQ